MEEFIGTVISTLNSPSPSEMSFVITKGNVHRGQFVEADYSQGTMIALITNVVKTNRYFERADSVKEFEARGSALFEQFPASEWEYLIANTKPLGVFQKEKILRASFPPSPGTRVRVAKSDTLKKFFKFDEEKGLNLGRVEFHDLNVKLNMTKLFKKHLAILSISGAGKCVSPRSRVLLSDGRRMEIGKLVEQHLAKQSVIEDGVEISYSNPDSLEVFSLSEKNKASNSKIKAFTRRKAPEEMLRIRTRSGRVLEVTPEHPIPIMNGSIEWLPAAKLKKGNQLLVAKPIVNSDFSLDQITNIEKFKPEYEYVYDLCVEDHNFVCEDLVIHNSYATSVLFEELLDRKKEHGRIACIVLDPHGEYSSFGEPVKDKKHSDYSDRTLIVKGRNVRISVPSLSVGILAGIIPGLSPAQKRDLNRILSELREEMKGGLGPFDFERVKKAISEDKKIKENTKAPLIGWLSELGGMRLFARIDSPSIRDIVRPGYLTVVDLSDIINIRKKQIIVSYFAQRLFNERRKKGVPPFLFVLEEAHQFTPEQASKEQAISRSIIRTIAREGRKFGAALCLISQRPVQLDTTALSQCNTKIILRVTNPYDLKHLAESAEAIDQRSMDMITSLQVGEALIIGEAVNYPLFFRVRERKSLPSKHEIPLEQAALEFEESKKKKDKETEAFL